MMIIIFTIVAGVGGIWHPASPRQDSPNCLSVVPLELELGS